MAHNSLRVGLALFLVCAVGMTDASAATLKAKTLRDWESYVQAIEKRINGELSGKTAFLALDWKSQEERERSNVSRRPIKSIDPMQRY